jgi:phosphate:Na+ symporter
LEERDNTETFCERMKNEEEYIDQMNKQIRKYIEKCFDFVTNPLDRHKLFLMRGIVSKIEHISDKCYGMSMFIDESAKEKVYFVDNESKDFKKFYDDNDEFFGTICNIMKNQVSSASDRSIFAELKERANEFEAFSENRRKEARNNAMIRISQDKSEENIMNIQETEDMYIDLMNRIEEISNDIYKISKYISKL